MTVVAQFDLMTDATAFMKDHADVALLECRRACDGRTVFVVIDSGVRGADELMCRVDMDVVDVDDAIDALVGPITVLSTHRGGSQ